jgi:hypothetical protein
MVEFNNVFITKCYLILELCLHNLKLCTYYKHWIYNCNKTMKQFYISTNKTCVLNLIGGGGPQPVGRFFIIHTFAMESPSFSIP